MLIAIQTSDDSFGKRAVEVENNQIFHCYFCHSFNFMRQRHPFAISADACLNSGSRRDLVLRLLVFHPRFDDDHLHHDRYGHRDRTCASR
jgi:hypothetical protein